MKSRVVLYYLLPLLLLVLLVGVNLWYGSVSLPPAEVWQALCGNLPADSTAHLIVCELRLPTLLTAALVGAALAVSGLLMQTVFSNPLADPSVLGVNAGAALGAATALLCMGGALGAAAGSWGGWLTVAGAAAVGAAAVMALLMACAVVVRNHLMLLVVGVMISYAVGAVVTLLSYFASADGLRSYVAWGMGNFAGVGVERLPVFAALVVGLCVVACWMAKPLNALLLGGDYARNLGYRVRSLRLFLLLLSGLLCALCTAFCGPIAFIGLAVPHVARFTLRTADHRLLVPATLLWGANLALLCNALSPIWGHGVSLPPGALTPLLGVPIAWLVLRRG